MLQLNYIRENNSEVVARLAIKNFAAKEHIEKIVIIDTTRRKIQAELDALNAETNNLAKQIGEFFKTGKQAEAAELKNKSIALKETQKKLDPYFSIGAGFRAVKNTFTTDDPKGSFSYYKSFIGVGTPETTPLPDMSFEMVAGMRYYARKNIALYSEIEIAKSIIQIGMSVGF